MKLKSLFLIVPLISFGTSIVPAETTTTKVETVTIQGSSSFPGALSPFTTYHRKFVDDNCITLHGLMAGSMTVAALAAAIYLYKNPETTFDTVVGDNVPSSDAAQRQKARRIAQAVLAVSGGWLGARVFWALVN